MCFICNGEPTCGDLTVWKLLLALIFDWYLWKRWSLIQIDSLTIDLENIWLIIPLFLFPSTRVLEFAWDNRFLSFAAWLVIFTHNLICSSLTMKRPTSSWSCCKVLPTSGWTSSRTCHRQTRGKRGEGVKRQRKYTFPLGWRYTARCATSVLQWIGLTMLLQGRTLVQNGRISTLLNPTAM